MGALVALRALSDHLTPSSFDVFTAITVASGVACFAAPWDRISRRWLHAVPLIATAEIAIGIRLAGAYGDVAANYYVLVGVFAGYAFSSRRAVAAHVVCASAASALPLLYRHSGRDNMAAKVLVEVLMVVVIAGIVTLLREGLQKRQHDLEIMAVRDPLTGVGNYRLLADTLDDEVARRHRSAQALTVMLLDLDGFKEVNDTLGHLARSRQASAGQAFPQTAWKRERCWRSRTRICGARSVSAEPAVTRCRSELSASDGAWLLANACLPGNRVG